MKTHRILIVDHDTDQVAFCREVLESVDFRVTEREDSRSARQAVEDAILEKDPYSAVLIELRLPMETGMEFYDWAEKHHKGLKVLIMSNHAWPGQESTARRAHAFLSIPFSSVDLVRTLDKVLARIPREGDFVG